MYNSKVDYVHMVTGIESSSGALVVYHTSRTFYIIEKQTLCIHIIISHLFLVSIGQSSTDAKPLFIYTTYISFSQQNELYPLCCEIIQDSAQTILTLGISTSEKLS